MGSRVIDVGSLTRISDWSGVRVGVAGLGIAGFGCADALVHVGAHVVVTDSSTSDVITERATLLEILGADVRLGDGDTLPADLDLLVVSPGLPPSHPIITSAQQSSVAVWGELELAWRMRDPNRSAPWLMITGTNGKTTATLMLESMLRAGGENAIAAGNIGHSLVEVVMNPEGPDVIAVEVGAPQLPFVYSVSPQAAVCLNLAPDHVDHFGSFEAYRDAKARLYQHTQLAAVYNVADPATERMVEEADVVEGCRAVGFTLGVPGRSMVGVVDDMLVDRAFLDDRGTHALELANVADVKPFAPHNVANALAAAALARAHGVSPAAVGEGLRSFTPAGHRIADAGEIGGVRYVDDSKATNWHAAQNSLLAYGDVGWIAGGLAKGQEFDELVTRVKHRLRGVVLLGADRELIAQALVRHAPDVPVVEVSRTDTGVMDDVVRAAHGLARPGDTVVLAPGCASWDMFRDYADRGEQFTNAVADLRDGAP
jgi:UDP-N-acetylmuramoylalanine--D-glutamate ligase